MRTLPLLVGVTVALALSACGGGGGTSGRQPITVNTLAYVVTECTEDATQLIARQALKIRQRNGETITVAEFPMLGPLPALGLCRNYGESSNGPASALVLPFQRLGVSPDGSVVVFEVIDDHSFLRSFFPPEGLVPPEREGFFAVNADGSHLRKLGPASRDPSFRYAVNAAVPFGILLNLVSYLGFSPDGQRVYLTDLGPGPDAQEAVQVFILELATGVRTQITRLPPLTPSGPVGITVGYPGYGGPGTVGFGLDSVESDGFAYIVTRADGGGEIQRFRPPVATGGGGFIPRFAITPSASFAATFNVPGDPVNPPPGDPSPRISEVFVAAGDNSLQLTRFGRSDTGNALSALSADALRVLFNASADPLASNPDHDCQLFSISTLGANLRQVTTWSNGSLQHGDCFGVVPGVGRGCFVANVGQDLSSDSVLFGSNCSPFSANAQGLELLAMRFDGSGLQQLTSTRGMTTDPDRTVRVELPGPWAYPDVFR